MARLRANNQGGAITVALTASPGTIHFGVIPNFQTLTGGDYYTIVLNRGSNITPGADNAFEIAYLTGYTAGDNFGTLGDRGEEDANFPACAHDIGATWDCGPTVFDFASTGGNATALQGTGVSATAPTANQVLAFDSGTGLWTAVTITASSDATELQGVSISSATPSNGQILELVAGVWTPSGTINANELQGTPVAATSPTTGDLLIYDGTSWGPSLTGGVDATQLQGTAIGSLSPTAGQVLTWDGTDWEAESPTAGGLTALGYPAPSSSGYTGFMSRYPPAAPTTGGSGLFGTFVQQAMPPPQITGATWSSGTAVFTFAQSIVGTLGQIGDTFTAGTNGFTPTGYNIGWPGGGFFFVHGTFTITGPFTATAPQATTTASPATVMGYMVPLDWYGPGSYLIGESAGAGPPAIWQFQSEVLQSMNVPNTLGSTPVIFNQTNSSNAVVTDTAYTLSGSTAVKAGVIADGIGVGQAVYIVSGSATLQAPPPNTHVQSITYDLTNTTITFDQAVAGGGSAITLGFTPDVIAASIVQEQQTVIVANKIPTRSGQVPLMWSIAEFGTDGAGGTMTGAGHLGYYAQGFYGPGVSGNTALGSLEMVAKAQGNAPGNGQLAHEVLSWFAGTTSYVGDYSQHTDLGYIEAPHAATVSYTVVSPAPYAHPSGQAIAPIDVTSFGDATSSFAGSTNVYTQAAGLSGAATPYGLNAGFLTYAGGTAVSIASLNSVVVTGTTAAYSWPTAGSGAIQDDSPGHWHIFSYQGAVPFGGTIILQNVNFHDVTGTVTNGNPVQPVLFVGKDVALTYSGTLGRALLGVSNIPPTSGSPPSYTLESGNVLVGGSNSQQLTASFLVDPSRSETISLTTGTSVTSTTSYVLSRQPMAYSTFGGTGGTTVASLIAAGTLPLTSTAGFPGPRSYNPAYTSARQQLASIVTSTGTGYVTYLWVNDTTATLEGCSWAPGLPGSPTVATAAAVYSLYQPIDGQEVVMINASISQTGINPTITFVPAIDLDLGSATRILNPGGSLSCRWKADLESWVETGFSSGSATSTGGGIPGLQYMTGGGTITSAVIAAAVIAGYTGIYLDPRYIWTLATPFSITGVNNFIIESRMVGSMGYGGPQPINYPANHVVATNTSGGGGDGLQVSGPSSGTETSGIRLRHLVIVGNNPGSATVHFGGGQRSCSLEHCFVYNTSSTAASYAVIHDTALTANNSEDNAFDDCTFVGGYAALGIDVGSVTGHANDSVYRNLVTGGPNNGIVGSGTVVYGIVATGGGNHQFTNWYDRSGPSGAGCYNNGATLSFIGGEDDNSSTVSGPCHLVSGGKTTIYDRSVTRSSQVGANANVAEVSGTGVLVFKGTGHFNNSPAAITLAGSGVVDMSDWAFDSTNASISGTAGTLYLPDSATAYTTGGPPAYIGTFLGTLGGYLGTVATRTIGLAGGSGVNTTQSLSWTPPLGVGAKIRITIWIRPLTAGQTGWSVVPSIQFTQWATTAAATVAPPMWVLTSAGNTTPTTAPSTTSLYTSTMEVQVDTSGSPVTVAITPAAQSGTATGGTTATLVESGATWTTNQWAGYTLIITSGTLLGATATVISNTSTTLTFAVNALGGSPASGNTFILYNASGSDNPYYSSGIAIERIT